MICHIPHSAMSSCNCLRGYAPVIDQRPRSIAIEGRPKRLADKTPMTERVNVVFSEMEHTLNHLPGRALSFISIDMDDSDCPSKTHLLADTAKFFRQYLKATSDNTAHRPCTADVPLDVARPIQTLLKTYSTWGSLGKCDAPITLHRTSHIRLNIASI